MILIIQWKKKQKNVFIRKTYTFTITTFMNKEIYLKYSQKKKFQ